MTNRVLGVGFVALGLCITACGDDAATSSTGAGASGSGAAGTGAGASGGGVGATGGAGGEAPGGGGSGGSGGSELPPNNGFPATWPDGTACASEEPVTVWAFSEDTYILRQSLCTNFEGPFLYLLLGETHALLQDTGTGDADVATVVTGLVDQWAAARGISDIELLVTHSHAHGDHVGGDAQFAGSGATVVGTSTNATITFFGFQSWPTDTVTLDLGGRVLDVLGIPGHHPSHVALYDRRHALLFTGDTLYPGRLYINDFAAYRASTQRLVDFVGGQALPVQHVLGTHIEMTQTPMVDFPFGSDVHPNEHELELGLEHLVELNDAVVAMGNQAVLEAHDDFIIYPL